MLQFVVNSRETIADKLHGYNWLGVLKMARRYYWKKVYVNRPRRRGRRYY